MPRSPSPHPLLSYSSPPTRLIVADFKPLKGGSGHLQSQDERCNKDSHPSHLPLHPIIVLCHVPNTCLYLHNYSCPTTPPRTQADSPLQTASLYHLASSLLCFSTHPKHPRYAPLYLPTRLGPRGAARVGRYDTKEWSGRVSRLGLGSLQIPSLCRSPSHPLHIFLAKSPEMTTDAPHCVATLTVPDPTAPSIGTALTPTLPTFIPSPRSRARRR